MIKYEDETYLTTAEASKYIGKNTTAFRQFMTRNNIPRRKLGGRLFFAVKDLNGYFARRSGLPHFEASNITYDDVYTIDQLKSIMLTTAQYIYSFLKSNNITRYKDNADQTLFDKREIDAVLSALKTPQEDASDL